MSEVTALPEAERAAILVMLLDEAQAAEILRQLNQDELRLLGEKMCALGEIGPALITQAIGGFVRRTERQGLFTHGRNDQVRTLMTEAVGPLKAGNLLQSILPEVSSDGGGTLEIARWLTPQALVPLVQDEHPQALAVLLVQLNPEVAAQVLASLPAPVQTEVVHRIATLQEVPGEALAMLEELLERRITASHGSAPLTMGGPREAADIINQAGKAAEKRIMPEIARIDRSLAKTIENEMFKFEHLLALEPLAMGALLRDVESDVLIDALKGIEEAQRDVFFRAMSSRAADGLRDEIAGRGRLKMTEVQEAQRQIVAVARRLANEGVIAFGAGGGEDDYV